MNETNIKHFFDGMRPLFDAAKQAQALLDEQCATAFSIFDYFKVGELKLSLMFANLLNPAETHGQGNLFLELFLKELGLSKEYPLSELKTCEVDREHGTNEGKRIDIVLRFADSTRWLGIENKPKAKEGSEQCSDYLDYLVNKDKGAKIVLLYLSGNGNPPVSIEGHKHADKCKTVLYRKTDGKPSIENWIERSRQACEAERVRWFLEETLKYIQRDFGLEGVPRIKHREDIMEKTMVNFITESPERLELAFGVESALRAVREKLICKFTKRIEDYLNEWINEKGKGREDWQVRSTTSDPKKHMTANTAWVVLYKTDWGFNEPQDDWPAAGAALNTSDTHWGNVNLCVAAHETYPKDLNEPFRNQLKEKLSGFEYGDYQPVPACKYLDDNLRNWNDEEFLKKFVDENQAKQMVRKVADQLCTLAESLDGMDTFTAILDDAKKKGILKKTT